MSYILDALKKSEQERGHKDIPDVQTVHSSGLHYQQQKKVYWPYFLIVAVLLNFVAIAYFIIDKDNAPTAETIAENIITERPAPVIKEPTNSAPTTISADSSNNLKTENKALKPVINKPAVKISHKKVKQPAIAVTETIMPAENSSMNNDYEVNEPTTTYSDNTIIDFNELPAAIKLQLPAIIISAHIYSKNPMLRSIVINNNFMEEGDYLIDDLILYEITPDGAILNYQGQLFSYGVVSGWQ